MTNAPQEPLVALLLPIPRSALGIRSQTTVVPSDAFRKLHPPSTTATQRLCVFAGCPQRTEAPSLRSGCRHTTHRVVRKLRSLLVGGFASSFADERRNGCDRMRKVAPVATRSRLLRRFRCSASLRSFASLRRSRSSETQTTHRVVRESFLVRRRLLRIDSADERRSPSDRMRLVGRAPRSPVLHGLALRTRRSGIFLRLLRARSSPHWFARLLARLVRTAVARTPSARPLRSARRTGRLLAPLVYSRLARARSLPSLLVHPAYFALLARRVPRRLVVRSAARSHETGAGHASHWRPTVSAVRFSAREAARLPTHSLLGVAQRRRRTLAARP